MSLLGLLVALAAGVGWIYLGVRRTRRVVRDTAVARADFLARQAELIEQYKSASAARSTEARRLASESVLLAYDKQTTALYALVGLEFEDSIEPVATDGTAVFVWTDRRWQTKGQIVRDLSPEQTLEAYRQNLHRAA